MKITTKALVQTALLLAICIASQFFKNLSVYITGSIVNLVLIIATLGIGMYAGMLVALVTPVTSFMITGSPLMAAIPLIIPAVMIGNCLLVFVIARMKGKSLAISLITASVAKSAFLGLAISVVLISVFGSGLKEQLIAAAKVTFSVTQLITALIGSFLAYIIYARIKKTI